MKEPLKFTNENGKLISKNSQTPTNGNAPQSLGGEGRLEKRQFKKYTGMDGVKFCQTCNIDISHKVSEKAYECNKCIRTKWSKAENRRIQIKRNGIMHKLVDSTIYFLYDHRCAICGWRAQEKPFMTPKGYPTKTFGCQIHHIIPVSENGTDALDNLIILCGNHHIQAGLNILSAEAIRAYLIPLAEIGERLKRIMAEKDTMMFEEMALAHERLDELF